MDLESFWQENKRLLVTLGCGLLLFLIVQMGVDAAYGKDVVRARVDLSRNRRDLNDSVFYTVDQRDAAREENAALKAALEILTEAVAFQPREGFALDPALGSASAQYFTRVEEVRESLDLLASRNRLMPPDGWGIEVLETASIPVIERHLEALDLIDRVARLAIEAGVERITKIAVRLDSSFRSRSGVRPVERTEVTFGMTTGSQSVTRLISLARSDRCATDRLAPLSIGMVEIKSQRGKLSEVKAEITFQVVRLHEVDVEDEP